MGGGGRGHQTHYSAGSNVTGARVAKRSTAVDSRSTLKGVRGFESLPSHTYQFSMRFLPVRARIPWRSAPPRDRHGCPLGKPHPIMSTLSPSALRYFAPRNPTLIAWNKTSHTGHQRSSRMQASLPSTIFPIPVRIAWYKQRNSPSNYAREWPAQHQEASSAEVNQGPGRPHACG